MAIGTAFQSYSLEYSRLIYSLFRLETNYQQKEKKTPVQG